jgi:Spy/CpxP family protein refolding chaperone
MKRNLALLIGAGLLFGSPALHSQQATASPTVTDQDIQLMRKDVQSDKKLIVAANMVLTDAEAQKFWPVYDQYAADLAKVNDTKLAVVKEYAANVDALSDAKAEDLARRWTEADSAAIQLRLKYLSRLQRVLPGTKAARFFQIDRRIGLVMDLQLASEIPLVTQ